MLTLSKAWKPPLSDLFLKAKAMLSQVLTRVEVLPLDTVSFLSLKCISYNEFNKRNSGYKVRFQGLFFSQSGDCDFGSLLEATAKAILF